MNIDLFVKRSKCPTCSAEEFTSIYKKNYADKEIKSYLINAYGQSKQFDTQSLEEIQYSLLQCINCNLIFQEYIPALELMSNLYEGLLGSQDNSDIPKEHGISYFSIYSQDIVQILAYLGKPPSSVKILDYGMGWGRWALMAKAFGCKVYGLELSEHRMKHAQKNGIQTIQWHELPDYQFDFINTDQVFEHLADPIGVLTQLKQSLKRDGLIKICVPNSFGIRYRLNQMDWLAPKGSIKSLNPVAPLEHINCFHRKSMLKLAQGLDLSEVKIPLLMQYQYTTIWNSPKRVLRNLLMPIYRNVFGLQNYYLFKN